MTEHRVKSWVPFFKAFESGAKKHDLRDTKDRNYQIGDTLILEEFDPFAPAGSDGYTGRKLAMGITYITGRSTPCAFSSAVLDRDYVILSLEPLGPVYGDLTFGG